jgi:hypothetical protein
LLIANDETRDDIGEHDDDLSLSKQRIAPGHLAH